MTILSHLNETLVSLSKAESRIAHAILTDPEAMVNITTAGLARLAGVSDPMISYTLRLAAHLTDCACRGKFVRRVYE